MSLVSAGIWLRVSTGGQDEANQRPDLERWCADHGYAITREYPLHGKSAYKGKQDALLEQVTADMRAGLISVLVVWQSSRIERRGAYSAFDLARRVREAGGRIEYVRDAYLNDANEMSDVMLALAATKDRQESQDKSDRTRHITIPRIRAEGGLYGRPPWGYAAEGAKYAKRLVPTAQGRRWAPLIWQRYADGASLREICAWLEAEGVTRGVTWTPKTLGDMLRNETYAGHRKDRQGRIVHHCEPIVDPVLFRRVTERLNSAPTKRGKAGDHTALLTSVLWCGRCGAPMYRGWTGRPGKRHAAYVCRDCPTTVNLAWLDATVNDSMLANQDTIVERTLTGGQSHDNERESIRLEMKALVAEDLPDDEFDARMSELRRRRDGVPEDEPGRWETTDTGVTYASQWEQAGHAAKRAILLGDTGSPRTRVTFAWADDSKRHRDPDEYGIVSIVPESWESAQPHSRPQLSTTPIEVRREAARLARESGGIVFAKKKPGR